MKFTTLFSIHTDNKIIRSFIFNNMYIFLKYVQIDIIIII